MNQRQQDEKIIEPEALSDDDLNENSDDAEDDNDNQ